jgi:hypothetical protein
VPCTLTCNYYLNQGQLHRLQILGYKGPRVASFADILTWLTQDVTFGHNEDGWDYFCQNLASMSMSACQSDPITGNKNIYADPTKGPIDTGGVLVLMIAAAIACATGGCKAVGEAMPIGEAGIGEKASNAIGQAVIGGVGGYANAAVQGGNSSQVEASTFAGFLSGLFLGPFGVAVGATESSLLSKALAVASVGVVGREAVVGWVDATLAEGPGSAPPVSPGGQASSNVIDSAVDGWTEFWHDFYSENY